MFNLILGIAIGIVASTVDEEDIKVVKDEVTKFENRVKRAIDAFNAE